jgi:hypothetical protein
MTAALAAAGAPASAQYGRLTDPARMITLFSQACVAGAPRFSAFVPVFAKQQRWDELGHSATARPGDRGWLIALAGQPAIVDIHQPAPGIETCSVSAVTAPNALVAAMTKREGHAPDTEKRQADEVVKGWTRSIERRPLSVTVPDGRAMARITMAASTR